MKKQKKNSCWTDSRIAENPSKKQGTYVGVMEKMNHG